MTGYLYVAVAFLAVGKATASSSIHRETCAGDNPLATITELVVEDCHAPPCLLVRGHNIHMNVTFIPNASVDKIRAHAFGKVADMSVPYKVPQEDACVDSGLTCPLEAQKEVTYFATLPVQEWYPLISVPVKWELLDQDDNIIFCTEILAKIVKPKTDHH